MDRRSFSYFFLINLKKKKIEEEWGGWLALQLEMPVSATEVVEFDPQLLVLHSNLPCPGDGLTQLSSMQET